MAITNRRSDLDVIMLEIVTEHFGIPLTYRRIFVSQGIGPSTTSAHPRTFLPAPAIPKPLHL
jgi:hypothetical protein